MLRLLPEEEGRIRNQGRAVDDLVATALHP